MKSFHADSMAQDLKSTMRLTGDWEDLHGIQTIAAGTLKAAPAGLPDGVASVWLAGG